MAIRWNLGRLECFVAVADELSFTRAAGMLRLSQPAVSEQVRRLERELGLVLFVRSTRHVEPTPAAQRLLPEVRMLLTAAECAGATATALRRAEHGDLRVGAPPQLALTLRYPGVTALVERSSPAVRIHNSPSVDLLPALRRGDLDVAFLCVPLPTDGLVVHPVEQGAMMLMVPRADPLAEYEVIPRAALPGRRILGFGRHHNEELWDEQVSDLVATGAELVALPEPSVSIMFRAAPAAGLPCLAYPWTAQWMAEAMGMVARRIEGDPCRYAIVLARRDIPPSPRLLAFWAAVVFASENGPTADDGWMALTASRLKGGSPAGGRAPLDASAADR